MEVHQSKLMKLRNSIFLLKKENALQNYQVQDVYECNQVITTTFKSQQTKRTLTVKA